MDSYFFFFQAEDGIRDYKVTGVQTCALPISPPHLQRSIGMRRTAKVQRRAVQRDCRHHHRGDGGHAQLRGGAEQLQQPRSEEHTSELQSPCNLVCRLLLEKKNNKRYTTRHDT